MYNVRQQAVILLVFLSLTLGLNIHDLNGDVLASRLQELVDSIGAKYVQNRYDELPYRAEPLNGPGLINELAQSLGTNFKNRIQAAKDLKGNIEQSYDSFTDVQHDELCCQLYDDSRLVYDPVFERKVDKDRLCVMVAGSASSNPRFAPGTILQTMKDNYKRNPKLKWQYFGAEDGTFFIWPAFYFDGCQKYDHRFKPFYVEAATPKPVRLVVALDRSGSMSGTLMDIAKDAAVTVLETVNPNDMVGVVTFSDEAKTPPGVKDDCYSTRLAQATPKNIDYLSQWIREMYPQGGTSYVSALEKAFELLNGTEESNKVTDKIILFLTDGSPTDKEEKIMDTIHRLNAGFGNSVILMTYGLGSGVNKEARAILQSMANQTGYNKSYGTVTLGQYKQIDDPKKLRTEMASYYSFISARSNATDSIISMTYVDEIRKSLVNSILLPVYIKDKLIGVVGTDISTSDMIEDVTYFQGGEFSYGFLIDGNGRTLTHPLLPRPHTVHEPPFFIDIDDLQPEIKDITASMKRGEPGSRLNRYSNHILTKGTTKRDGVNMIRLKTHYHWHPVSGTNFSVCIVLADKDRQALLPDAKLPVYKKFVYHNLALQDEDTCIFFKRRATKEATSVKMCPFAFMEPNAFLYKKETPEIVEAYEKFFKGQTSENPGFRPNVRSAVAVSIAAEEFWLKEARNVNDKGIHKYLIWQYFGTIEGVVRIYPGIATDKEFDHTIRPWYKRTVAHRGQNVMSAPYVDTWDAGFVITLSRTIFQGLRDGDKHTPDDLIAGVIATDFTLESFYIFMNESYPVCSLEGHKCFMIDSSGYLVMHPDFVTGKDTDIGNRHVIDKLPSIAKLLLDARILKRQACINHEDIRYFSYWMVSLSPTKNSFEHKDKNGITDFLLVKIKDSNTFIGIYRGSNLTKESCFCKKDYSHCSTNVNDATSCECPCYTLADFGYCKNRFALSSDSWPACRPRTPEPDYQDKILAEAPLTKGLSKCFDKKCHQRNFKSDCFGVSGCRWCEANSTMPTMNGSCVYYGEMCATEVSQPTSSNKNVLIGSIVGVVVLAALIIGVTARMVIRKRRQPYSAAETMSTSGTTGERTSNSEVTIGDNVIEDWYVDPDSAPRSPPDTSVQSGFLDRPCQGRPCLHHPYVNEAFVDSDPVHENPYPRPSENNAQVVSI